jgi:ribosome-associated heat shock protein Hsp15
LDRQRLDKWLWHARVVKARTSAAALVEAGHVRINGVREKAPGHAVKAGDVLTVGLDRTVRVLKVTGFSERRCCIGACAVRGSAEAGFAGVQLKESSCKESGLKTPRE